MKRTPIRRKTPLRSRRGLVVARSETTRQKRKPMKSRNSARQRRSFARQFGSRERVAFVNSLACVVGKDCEGPTQNHHVRSRGAGGIASDIVPVCHKHHRQTHDGNALVTRDYLEYAAGMTELAWLAASAPVKGAADV